MIKAEWTNADALNLQPTCNQLATDCISRQAAIDAVCANGDYYDIIAALERLTADTVAILENVPPAQPTVLNAKKLCEFWDSESNICALHRPSAQPEPKKGKWIDMGDFEQCSGCTGTHLKEVNTVYGKAIWIKSAYCPNCGAKMEEEDEQSKSRFPKAQGNIKDK